MFEKRETMISGCFELQPRVLTDIRGKFVKTYHADYFASNELETDFQEHYYSVSRKGVLRGMHFQNPPNGHNKLVYCTTGAILDVVIDLRVESPSYLEHVSLELSSELGNMLYIPEGLAHGFYSVTDATVSYNVSSTYSPESDDGVLWSSIGMDWPDAAPHISERDSSFIALSDFQSPFKFK
tara:strand:- start:2239 stop:2784 length:546 start_codon:yes stop_codon:yes gene_type:complete